jgi:hypothetical protein
MDRGMKFSLATGLLLAALVGCYWGLEQPCTARVVDAETGKPVEGAVYLAAWYSTTWLEKAWFEGPSTKMSHFREGFTDANGEIHVPGFWFKVPFIGRDRNLTVYKPGYAMWNQDYLFPSVKKRKNFRFFNRTAELETWREDYSYWDHNSFLINAFRGNFRGNPYTSGNQIFYKNFNKNEKEPFRKERQKNLGD